MTWKVYVLFLLSSFPYSRGHISKRGLIFPPTSLYGTFVAIAVPLDIPDKNVFVSYNFECNYSVVTNITELDEVMFPNLPVVTGRHSRSITREMTYKMLETKFDEHGINGKECLLRNICEAAETPLYHSGLLGHIMHIVFTSVRPHYTVSAFCLHPELYARKLRNRWSPSSTMEEGLSNEYYKAEDDGVRGHCDKYLDLCPFSLFDFVTRLVEFPHNNI